MTILDRASSESNPQNHNGQPVYGWGRAPTAQEIADRQLHLAEVQRQQEEVSAPLTSWSQEYLGPIIDQALRQRGGVQPGQPVPRIIRDPLQGLVLPPAPPGAADRHQLEELIGRRLPDGELPEWLLQRLPPLTLDATACARPDDVGTWFDTPPATPPQLLNGCLVQGQISFLAAATKALKTRLALARMVAIVTGRPWLSNPEWVPTLRADGSRRKAGIWSRESGRGVLSRRLNATLHAMGIGHGGDEVMRGLCRGHLYINPHWLPDLTNAVSSAEWVAVVRELDLDIAILDPMLFCLGGRGEQIANDAVIGPILSQLQAAIYPCTLEILHHNLLRLGSTPWPSLNDMSYGWGQRFARQWCMLDRVGEYNPNDRSHRLRMHLGGSDDQAGGDYFLDVVEGRSWERWHCAVTPRSQVVAAAGATAVADREIQRALHMQAVVAHVGLLPGISRTALTINTRPTLPNGEPMPTADVVAALMALTEERPPRIICDEQTCGARTYHSYRLVPVPPPMQRSVELDDHQDASASRPPVSDEPSEEPPQ
jgi:hypothetical protein